VDDNLTFHSKVVAAGNPAMGLWVRAGAWAACYLTDGYIPTDIAHTIGTQTQAARLIESGLWRAVDGGYQIHEFLDRNPTKERVEAERFAAKERQARARGKSTMKKVHQLRAER
jgi:hypothetical protein